MNLEIQFYCKKTKKKSFLESQIRLIFIICLIIFPSHLRLLCARWEGWSWWLDCTVVWGCLIFTRGRGCRSRCCGGILHDISCHGGEWDLGKFQGLAAVLEARPGLFLFRVGDAVWEICHYIQERWGMNG